jgi:hypothetical protein
MEEDELEEEELEEEEREEETGDETALGEQWEENEGEANVAQGFWTRLVEEWSQEISSGELKMKLRWHVEYSLLEELREFWRADAE